MKRFARRMISLALVLLTALAVLAPAALAGAAEKSEAELVAQATEALKAYWLQEVYKGNGSSEQGYLEILHTQVSYISDEAASLPEEDVKGRLFHDVYCVVDFVLLSDLYGTAPYYLDANAYYSVAIYRDGSAEVMVNSLFRLYASRTYIYDFSDIISSISNCGSDYNAVFLLREE